MRTVLAETKANVDSVDAEKRINVVLGVRYALQQCVEMQTIVDGRRTPFVRRR